MINKINYQISCIQIFLQKVMHSESSEQESPLKKQPSKKQQALTFFSKLQLGDLCFMDIIKYGFALFGLTKAGKTTLAHLLVKNSLVGKEKATGQTYYNVNQNILRLKEAKIGQTRQSETQIPNQCIFQVRQIDNSSLTVHILDCPGYEDSNGCNMLVANGYFHYRIFSKVQNIKFVLTFDYNDMSGIFQKPKATLVEFFSSFKDYAQIKNQIMAATVFVFTKAERKQPFNEAQMNKNVISKLLGLRDCTGVDGLQQRDFIKEMINNVIDNEKKKFFIFYKAVKDATPLNNDDLLQRIHENTQFWTRKIITSDKQQTVDMNDIEMTLGKRVRTRAQYQQKFKNNFIELMGTFGKRFKEAFLEGQSSLKKITAAFIEDSCLRAPQSRNFFNFICEFNATYNLYENQVSLSPKYVQKRKIIQDKLLSYKCEEVEGKGIEWIQKLQIMNLIILMIQKEEFGSMQNSRTVPKFQLIAHIILKIIGQFKKIKFDKKPKNYENELNKFSYIVYRLLQEAKTFKIIFSSDFEVVQFSQTNTLFTQWVDTTLIVYDFVKFVSNQAFNINDITVNYIDFQEIKIKYFINKSQIVKSQEQLPYYLEIQKYYKDCNQIENKKLADGLAQLTTIKLKSNAKIERNQTVCSLIEKIRILKRNLMLDNQCRQIEAYIQVINELGEELSKIDNNHQKKQFTDKQSCKFAIKFFKHSGNVYKVFHTFKLLLSKYNEVENSAEVKDILIEYGQYASTHGRKQLAIQAYQHADYLIDRSFLKKDGQDYLQKRQQERKRINRMIGLLGIHKRYDPSEAYYDDLMKNKHHKLIQDSLLELTEKTFPRNK